MNHNNFCTQKVKDTKFNLSGIICKNYEKIFPTSMLRYDEAQLLYYLINFIKGGNIANLGHAKGTSAIIMASSLIDNNLNGIICSIDLFNGVYCNYINEINRIKDYNLEYLIRLYVGSTNFWGKIFLRNKKKFKLIFIDADHSYNSVKNDFEIWSLLLDTEGFIVFHDVNKKSVSYALRDTILKNNNYKQLKEFNINRIKVFKKV